MTLSQAQINETYEQTWGDQLNRSPEELENVYSNHVEDAVMHPVYKKLVSDFQIKANGGHVLDVGSGSGRWIRFLTDAFKPELVVGMDYTKASVEFLNKRFANTSHVPFEFRHADITQPSLDLGRTFDLINIGNVLFHIPEDDKFAHALANVSKALKPGAHVITTEYLPRTTMLTDWMKVRSRYTFERLVNEVGMDMIGVKAISVFCNHALGVEGETYERRRLFDVVRDKYNTLHEGANSPQSKQFVRDLMVDVEQAVLSFCEDRIPDIEMPSQKLVVLRKRVD